MAEALVESLTADVRARKYHDDYREQVLDLIEQKAAGEEFEVPEVGGREAEGRRPDGGARGQRRGGQDGPQAPPDGDEAARPRPKKSA